MSLSSPKKKTVKHYDFFEVMEFMEKKYNFDHRDMGRRGEWYVTSGLSELTKKSFYKVAPLNFDEEQRKDHELYQSIMNSEPPYRDYWHLMCDSLPGNGSYLYWNWFDGLENHPEDWQKEVCKYFIEEYGEKARDMKFWVEW